MTTDDRTAAPLTAEEEAKARAKYEDPEFLTGPVADLVRGLIATLDAARQPATSESRPDLAAALADISQMLPGSVPLPMTEEEYLRSMLMECVRKARAALASPPEGLDAEQREAADRHIHTEGWCGMCVSHGRDAAQRLFHVHQSDDSVASLDTALGSLDEDDVTYSHSVSVSGEPMDPVAFVNYERLRAALARRLGEQS